MRERIRKTTARLINAAAIGSRGKRSLTLVVIGMPCYTPLKGYKDAISGGLTFDHRLGHEKMEVACGSCLGCRVDSRIMWAIRIVHESYVHLDHNGNSWVTLTYRDPSECTDEQYKKGHFIPADFSLQPSHVSKFIRALRKQNKHKIRYFYCGEYGDENERPHYHVCLFNHSFDDQQLFEDNEGFYTYTSPSLEKLWPYGFSTVAELNFETASYTAGYCFKKITGKRADDHYLRCDEHGEAYWLRPEYIRMSTGRTKPCGLGAQYYAEFKNDIFPSDETPVPGHGTVQLVPRYYQNILESEDPETLVLVKSLRERFMQSHRDDFTPERLRDKYICARAQQDRLKRAL